MAPCLFTFIENRAGVRNGFHLLNVDWQGVSVRPNAPGINVEFRSFFTNNSVISKGFDKRPLP